jgi:hypothetical protein
LYTIEKPRKGQKSKKKKADDPDTACQRSGMRGRQESGMKKPEKKWTKLRQKSTDPIEASVT